MSELCVWIDPIDNTKGFINGTLDCVTVLIGLSRNKRAYLGILGLPYRLNNQTLEFHPEILVGVVSASKSFSTTAPNIWSRMERAKANNPLKFSISDTRGHNSTI